MTAFVGHSHKICAIAAIFLTGRHIAGCSFKKAIVAILISGLCGMFLKQNVVYNFVNINMFYV